LSGSIDSLATVPDSSASVLASTSLDRYFRLHSTVPLPNEAGGKLDHKGHVIGRLYVKSTPTAVAWADQRFASPSKAADNDKTAEDTVWDDMERVSDIEEENGRARKRKKTE
jgi:ribosome biogenesis protein NSA1